MNAFNSSVLHCIFKLGWRQDCSRASTCVDCCEGCAGMPNNTFAVNKKSDAAQMGSVLSNVCFAAAPLAVVPPFK